MRVWAIALGLFFVALLVSGCTETVRYQCTDGKFVTDVTKCPTSSTNVNAATCPACEPRIEYKDKIVEKTITTYVCADGKQVSLKEQCIDYINYSWNLSANKEALITRLNGVQDPLGMTDAVDVTKLINSETEVTISYTLKTGSFQKQDVGQTMFAVLKETAAYLKANKRLNYDITITSTTSNGGYVYSRKTTSEEVLKILNYEESMDEWIAGIKGGW